MHISKKLINMSLITAIIFAASSIHAMNDNDHAVFKPGDMKFQPGIPDSLPKGVEAVVLEGNPANEGPFTIRLKFPANYKIAPHWHPKIEHITVISGELGVGMGDKLDEAKAVMLPAKSFAYMQPQIHHFAFTHKPTEIQLHGNGPWGITYVNPQDDPRNKQ